MCIRDRPKAVRFSHRQLVLHTLAVAANLANQPDDQSFRRDDIYMPITPMFHVHAWGIPFVATMLGVKQVYPGRYIPDRLIALKAVSYTHLDVYKRQDIGRSSVADMSITTATRRRWRRRRSRAARLMRYPTDAAAARIRSRSSGRTSSLPRNARDTVIVETPAIRATSAIVTRPVFTMRLFPPVDADG